MSKCAYCKYNDGAVYTSTPPKYRCTVTGEYHLALDDCNVDFAPVKHGHWIVDKSGYPSIICSECGVKIPMVAGWCMDAHINYCPNCGAKMDEVEE